MIKRLCVTFHLELREQRWWQSTLCCTCCINTCRMFLETSKQNHPALLSAARAVLSRGWLLLRAPAGRPSLSGKVLLRPPQALIVFIAEVNYTVHPRAEDRCPQPSLLGPSCAWKLSSQKGIVTSGPRVSARKGLSLPNFVLTPAAEGPLRGCWCWPRPQMPCTPSRVS